jgi:hypothetical protein
LPSFLTILATATSSGTGGPSHQIHQIFSALNFQASSIFYCYASFGSTCAFEPSSRQTTVPVSVVARVPCPELHRRSQQTTKLKCCKARSPPGHRSAAAARPGAARSAPAEDRAMTCMVHCTSAPELRRQSLSTDIFAFQTCNTRQNANMRPVRWLLTYSLVTTYYLKGPRPFISAVINIEEGPSQGSIHREADPSY